MTTPIPFSPSLEVAEPDEAATTQELIATLLKISAKTYQDGHHALRSVHAKSHAILTGKLEVLPSLPPELAQGLFETPAYYKVILRLSSTPGDLLADSVSTPRGLAMKVLGVPGVRLPGSEQDTTQDFIMVNGPAFGAPNAKKFLKNLKLLAGTTDKAPALKSVLSAALRGAERLVEAAGGESGTLKSLGGEPPTHPLGETYYTQAPLLYGRFIAKLALVPVSTLLTSLKGVAVKITASPNAIRETIEDFFRMNAGVWEVRAQLCRDLQKMPIEDASVVWPEEASPYLPVARLTVPPQTAWSESRSRAVDDGVSFSPWHGIAAHRPLGSIMRVRRATYEASVNFRSEHNHCPIHEPTKDFLET